jgi:hypothetical protein
MLRMGLMIFVAIGRIAYFVLLMLIVAGPAHADRFHVRSGGVRTGGPSDPGS